MAPAFKELILKEIFIHKESSYKTYFNVYHNPAIQEIKETGYQNRVEHVRAYPAGYN